MISEECTGLHDEKGPETGRVKVYRKPLNYYRGKGAFKISSGYIMFIVISAKGHPHLGGGLHFFQKYCSV